MGKLRRWILLFVASTVLFVSLYLEILAPLPGLEPHPWIYFLVCLAILGEFILPLRLITPFYYFTVSVVLVLAAGFYLLPSEASLEAIGNPLFSLVIELGFAAWLIYAAHTIAAALRVFEAREEILRVIGIEDPSLDLEAAGPQIHAEITRSRHYERPLAVVLLESVDLLVPEALEESGDSFSSWVAREYTRARFARVVKRELRAMDLVLKDPETHNLVLLCPEIGAAEVHEVTHHLETILHREFGIQPRIASACFPQDGISFEGLYQRASGNLAEMVEEAESTTARTKLDLGEKIYANK